MPSYWNNADNELALFGLSDDEKLVWNARFELFMGICVILSLTCCSSQVFYIHAKISDSSVNADAMRVFLFISAVFGLIISYTPLSIELGSF